MSDEGTLVLSDESKTRKVAVSLHEARVARMRQIAEMERDTEGPLWTLTEGRFPDEVNLPGRHYAHLWRIAESPVEAFHLLAPRLLEEVAMMGYGLSIQEMETGWWLCTLVAEERRK